MQQRSVSVLARVVAGALAAGMLAACRPGPLASPSPGASPTPTAIGACPSAAAPATPQVLVRNQGTPDDLAFDNGGQLLFTDISKGTLARLQADGSVQIIASGLLEPEGIVVQKDGRILVAEQGRNRIVAIDAQSQAVSPWRTFANHTANAGIDGIGPSLPDASANGQPSPTAADVIVPDSPNGVVWEVAPDGKTATMIASGMVRPVGAAIDASGRIFVADEGGALWVLDPGKRRFTTLPTPDDVLVTRDSYIFVNTLGDNAIHELDAQAHQLNVIRGIAQPQGMALDGADNLYYTEFNGGRIDRLVRTFTLGPAKVTRVRPSTFLICPSVERAARFTAALTMSSASGKTATILQLVQPGTDSSGGLEVQTADPTLTITVEAAQSGQPPLTLSQTITLSP